MEDNFSTKIPLDALDILLRLGNEFAFDPLASQNSEEFFLSLLRGFSGEHHGLEEWLRSHIQNAFRCVGARPNWIQGSAWPFTSEGPMVFVGQLDIPAGLFHDEASFFTFYKPETGQIATILQVA